MFEINNTESMDKFKTEYDRIIETLKSCKIQSQLDATEKYYKLFIIINRSFLSMI